MSQQQIHNENLKEIERLNNDLSDAIIKNTQKVLDMNDQNFTGDLRESVKKGNINEKGFHTVIVDNPHGVPVEFGMPSGIHVNFDELRKWVEGKLGIPADQSKDITFKIWKKILDKGIPQTRFFKKGIKMTIFQVGTLNLRTVKPRDKWMIRIKKINRNIKKATKYINKVNRRKNKLSKI